MARSFRANAPRPGQADEVYSHEQASGGKVQISRWAHLHFQQDRELDLTVIKVEREAAKGTKRDRG